jgi:bifunctional N-acetylglucosamine-1-phosphate-uridyltransferase/glucosamine-1-phosphate-acetyltransferase GlmU-like protein
VPADALALSRAEQKIIEGWVSRKRKKSREE